MPVVTGQDAKVWQKVFQELIQEVKPRHQWTLTLDKGLTPNTLQPGWAQYQQWAFARFTCSLCSRSWASAQVCVLCHMHWSKIESKGQVRMRIFAQRCKKCSQPPFEDPEFTEENTSRIVNNLVLRILRSCYREGPKSAEIPTIKDTVLQGPHDTNNCEACLQGSCAQGGLGVAKEPPVSPSLPKISSPDGGIPAYQPSPARSSTQEDAAPRNTWVKEGKVFPNPWFPEPPLARSPRVNTTHGSDSIIPISSIENSHSSMAQNRTPCYGPDSIIPISSIENSCSSMAQNCTPRYGSDSIIPVSSIENSHSSMIQNRTPRYSDSHSDISSICCCNSNIRWCLSILILILILILITILSVVLWWSFS